MEQPMLTVEETAQRLNVSAQTVIREIKAGALKAAKVRRRWRIDPADLAAYLERAHNARQAR